MNSFKSDIKNFKAKSSEVWADRWFCHYFNSTSLFSVKNIKSVLHTTLVQLIKSSKPVHIISKRNWLNIFYNIELNKQIWKTLTMKCHRKSCIFSWSAGEIVLFFFYKKKVNDEYLPHQVQKIFGQYTCTSILLA